MKLLLLLPLLALTSSAQEDSLLTIHRIETETADRIQSRVLDPILGAGQSSAFVKVTLEVKRAEESSDRAGVGRSGRVTSKAKIEASTSTAIWDMDGDSIFRGFGFGYPHSAKPPFEETQGQRQMQEAHQTKGTKEERVTLSNSYRGSRVVILHDAKIPPSKIAAVRAALVAIYKPDNLDLNFHPVEFSALK